MDFRNNGVEEELIESFIDKIFVHKDYFEWKLKFINKSIKLRLNGKKQSDITSVEWIK